MKSEKDIINSNIWEEAVKEKNKQFAATSQEKTAIIVGHPCTGTSLFIKENHH